MDLKGSPVRRKMATRGSKVPQGRLDSNGATRCKQIGPKVIQFVPRVYGSARGRLTLQEDQGKVGL